MPESRSCSVVDDSRAPRAAARRTPEGSGFAVREAGHGAEALETCRAARAESGPDRPLVVPRTTGAGLERVVEALRAGAQEYVMKPCDEAILRGKLAQAGLLPPDERP